MIHCPHCQSTRLRVIGSAHKENDGDYFRRHRKCIACGRNFHTKEYVEGYEPMTDDDKRIALSFLAKAAKLIAKKKRG